MFIDTISKNQLKKYFKIIGLSCFAAFLLFSLIVSSGFFVQYDVIVNRLFGGTFRGFFFVYSKILEYLYLFLGVLCLQLFWKFYKKRERMEALLLSITVFSSIFAQFFVKPLFDILCPGTYYNSVFTTYRLLAESELFQRIALTETCYPSNHTVAYIVICSYIALLMHTYFPKRKTTNYVVFLLVLIVFTVGITRVYLHVHWLSDVIAGYLLGGALVSGIFWTRLHRREFRKLMKAVHEKMVRNRQ